ncbi:hypothetical protein PMIN07_006416 [Paraphaeosphaeria minitans]
METDSNFFYSPRSGTKLGPAFPIKEKKARKSRCFLRFHSSQTQTCLGSHSFHHCVYLAIQASDVPRLSQNSEPSTSIPSTIIFVPLIEVLPHCMWSVPQQPDRQPLSNPEYFATSGTNACAQPLG